MGHSAKEASRELANLGSNEKNKILKAIQQSILDNTEAIIAANHKDMEAGKENGLSEGLLDRLLLTEERLQGMADSVEVVIDLEDPVGQIDHMKTLDNGLILGKKTVPMGVISIIYESRPNVTLDASILAIKSGNAVILRGGKEAINSNQAIAKAIRKAIQEAGYNPNIVNLIEDTTRESSKELMQLNDYVDLLIPRGSAGLIQSVIENAKVPVLQTGVGNCHIYVDDTAKLDMALSIVENAKTQRVGVCNAMESLLVSEQVSDVFYEELEKIIEKYDITVYGCEKAQAKMEGIKQATHVEYAREYLDYAFSIKIVEGIDEAIDHIATYSTGHSDVIITEDYEHALRFLNEVDSACVYVNASSRFTDGGVFGMGAEMGISTQKLHARGPVGLEELTSSKYIILGTGQIRE